MLAENKNQFNLREEILEAAKLLKEEQDLIGSPEEIAKIIFHWLGEELEEIEHHYLNSSMLQRRIFNLELNTEALSALPESMVMVQGLNEKQLESAKIEVNTLIDKRQKLIEAAKS